jgi:hypothetical protein
VLAQIAPFQAESCRYLRVDECVVLRRWFVVIVVLIESLWLADSLVNDG